MSRCEFTRIAASSQDHPAQTSAFPGVRQHLDEDKLREDTANAMRAAGISPALIYAYEETGLIVTQENRRLIPDVELREFDAKVREYHDLGLGETSKLD